MSRDETIKIIVRCDSVVKYSTVNICSINAGNSEPVSGAVDVCVVVAVIIYLRMTMRRQRGRNDNVPEYGWASIQPENLGHTIRSVRGVVP